MHAVVEIAGKQFQVEKNKNIKVPLLEAEGGSKVVFDRVLTYTDDAGVTEIGQPLVNNMTVTASVVEHGRDKKVIVFKKKRRKGYQKKNGHRQGFSLIKIEDISIAKPAKAKSETAAKPKAEVKEAKAPAAAKKTAAKKAPAVKKETAAKKAPAAKKEAKPKTETKAKTAKPKAAPKKAAAKAKEKEA